MPPIRQLFVTVHPSYLLRLPDERAQAIEYRRFVDELGMIAEALRETPPQPQPANTAKSGQLSLF